MKDYELYLDGEHVGTYYNISENHYKDLKEFYSDKYNVELKEVEK